MKGLLILFIFLLSFGQLFSQNSLFSIVPSIGIGEGFYKYQTNPYKNNLYPFKKVLFNPFSPVDVLFGLNIALQYKQKHTFAIGIANSHASYAYSIKMGTNIDTIYNPPTTKIIIETTYKGKENGRPTLKFPFSYTYTFNKNNDRQTSPDSLFIIRHAKKKLNLQFGINTGLSLIMLKKVDSYSDLDDDRSEVINKDTIRLTSYHKDITKWGSSASIGVIVLLKCGERKIAQFYINYDIGMIPLYNQFVLIERNNNVEYTNRIRSSGSMLHFGFSFPIKFS